VRVERFRRVLQRLAEASVGLEPQLIGLTRFHRTEAEGGHHGAAIAVLTLLMARRLGVSRSQQLELALSGLFHDVGRGSAPAAGAEPSPLMARRGPLGTALRLLGKPLSPSHLERVLAAHDAAQPLINPSTQEQAGLPGRLVAVPCAFDLLTFPGPGQPGLPPDQALRVIANRAGTRFDPRVVKLFTTVAGFYPVGTLVRLSGGELGVVMDVPATPALATKPQVRVIQDPRGRPVDYLVDLAEPGQKRAISTALSSAQHDVNVSHFLFS
jgi:hypothetical protein